MGFYFRKSLKLGPMRFNLSKSGIGVSTGIRGFRIGSGPRGNYVHIGAGGFYYRQTISPNKPSANTPLVLDGEVHSDTHGPMHEIASTCPTKMRDSTSFALLTELESKRKRIRATPFAIVALILAFVLLWKVEANGFAIAAIGAILFGAVVFAYYWDLLKKSVVMMYDLEPEIEETYKELYAAIDRLAQAGAVWHITAKGNVHDPKYHAGASHLIQRKKVSVGLSSPPFVSTNISVSWLPITNGGLYFFPDTVLVFTSKGVGAVGYDDIHLEHSRTKFIEEEHVPRDARIVDRTWRYVNKKGGPDRRFNNNRELPVCEYEEIRCKSISGLNEHFQTSRLGTAEGINRAIKKVASALIEARVGVKWTPETGQVDKV
jgi:hypothetical protein